MGLYWTGTGFEERLNLMPLSAAHSATTEPQQPMKLECTSEKMSSLASAGEEFQSTRYRAPRKMVSVSGSHFLVQADTRHGTSQKESDDVADGAGPVSYDPDLGAWVRAQEVSASASKAEVPPELGPAEPQVLIALGQSQRKTSRDSNSRFKWTSWFHAGAEQRRVLVTPPPVSIPEAPLESVAISEDAPAESSSIAAQDSVEPETQLPAVDEVVCAPASSRTDAQHLAIPDAQNAVEEDADAKAASPVSPHDVAAPQATTSDPNGIASIPASAQVPALHLGGRAWQLAFDREEARIQALPRKEQTARTAPDRNVSRWFVLKSVLGGEAPVEVSPSRPEGTVPVLEVFSLAGGVGKTSLVATLGRALAALGEQALLVEATPSASLQYFFGSCDCLPGVMRAFRPPISRSDAPIRLASVAPETLLFDSVEQGLLAANIQKWAQGATRVVADVGTGSRGTIRGLAKISPLVLVPLAPDVNSVIAANAVDSFLQRQTGASGGQPNVLFVLNRFDPSLTLHLEVRKVLSKRLGERLLPFAIERTPGVSEALAEGMTIMDYAPDSKTAASFTRLAKWLQDVQASAATGSCGRWREL
jgi:cellulose biosynthesis protein BcsQ